MHFYRTLYETTPGAAPDDYSHHTALADAHAAAKGYLQAWNHHLIFIELIDVPTDKAGILDLLRGYDVQSDFRPIKTWKINHRGGLVETENRE